MYASQGGPADKPLTAYDGGPNEKHTTCARDFTISAKANPKPPPSALRYFVPRGAPVSCYHVSCPENTCRRSDGEGFTVTVFSIKQPTLKRKSISHKPLYPIRSPKTLADVRSQRTPSRSHRDSGQPAIRSTPLPLQLFSNNSSPMASMANAEGFGGTGSNAGEGGLGDETNTGIEIPLVSGGAVINPKNTLSNLTGALQSPMDKEKPTRAIALANSIDSDLLQPPRLDRNRSNLIDVVFIISCREEMRPYINDVVAFVKREIQRYRASAKDYRVGIITSEIEFTARALNTSDTFR